MLQVFVDWWGRRLGKAPVELNVTLYDEPNATGFPLDLDDESPVSVPSREPTKREIGIRFQREEFMQLLNTVGHWDTIEFFTADRVPIDTIDDLPRGPDDGIDAMVRITARTERGALIIAGRLRSIMVNQSYGVFDA